jgi:hypothetical protein
MLYRKSKHTIYLQYFFPENCAVLRHCCVSSPTMATRTPHIVTCILKSVNQPRMRTLSVVDYIVLTSCVVSDGKYIRIQIG